jgi:hypothetical protein
MPALHWKDLEDPATGEWQGLLLQCPPPPGSRAPGTRLLSGGNGRLQWMCGGQTVFWATQCDDYSGVWLIRALPDLPPHALPVDAIDSAQVERGKAWAGGDAWFKHWSRFFASQLRDRPGSFLHHGQWLMRGLRPATASMPPRAPGALDPVALRAIVEHVYYRIWGRARHLPDWGYGLNLTEALSADPVQWIDWGINGNGSLIALRQPRDDDDRVRWWRKKAREHALPPVLALFLSCLDAYIIIDGHCRLRAALLEGAVPDVIVIALSETARFPHATPNAAVQERIVDSLLQGRRRDGQPLPVDDMNRVLLATFDDTPYISIVGNHAKARLTEDRWRAEVSAYLTQAGQTEHLAGIMGREGL